MDVTDERHALPAFGCWINVFEPTVGELVARAGYDYAMLDMEHTPVTLDRVLPMVRAVQLGGAKALVRVPDRDPAWLGRLMDLGADGAMVPMIESPAEAERLARAALYAPEGTRGMAAGIVRASGHGLDADYVERCRAAFLLLVQIETRQALECADGIAAVDGIDMIFVGPYDLAGSLGHRAEPDHRETRAAIRKVLAAAKNAGKPLATIPTPAVGARKLFGQGFDLVFSGSDVAMLREGMVRDVAAQTKALRRD